MCIRDRCYSKEKEVLNMHAWEQIQQTLDYIEEHLSEATDIEKLANMAGLSTFYFQRLFRRLVKKMCIRDRSRSSSLCFRATFDRNSDGAESQILM